jgi:hypothetical protein
MVEHLKNNKHYTVRRRAWGYQRGNQNPQIQEEQTTQWPNDDLQNMHIKIKI